MKILRLFLFLVLLVALNDTSGQSAGIPAGQTVRGVIRESESQFPLPGVRVVVLRDSAMVTGAYTDEEGVYAIRNIAPGKISITFELLGYRSQRIDNVDVTSAKEVILNIGLDETTTEMETVEISATREGEVKNEMALISARQFSVEETNRYAGSRGDPARMASNFAGVQGADDSRNDIVIRGNSPQGVLWRFEGIDLPNPNHFAIPGTAGGPVSIVNNKYLANSDFFTGAFPAEYGNSIAGVFDLKMRNGNNENHEFSAQFGFLGTELFAEGPVSKKSGSSYLASYRYSTLQLFDFMGIKIGTDAVPLYQDGAFRLFFPGKKNSSFAIWGLGGISSVDILISDQKDPDEVNIYGENDRDQYYKSRMGVGGITYTKSFNESTFLKTTVSYSANIQDSYHELVYRHLNAESHFVVDSLVSLLDYTFDESKLSWAIALTKKMGRKHTVRLGMNTDQYFWGHVDSVRVIDTTAADYYQWNTRWNSKESGWLFQPYVQYKFKPSDQWTLTAGWHASVFMWNRSMSFVEPRLAARWQFRPNQSVSLGLGRHSQLQPTYMYFYQPAPADCNFCEQPAFLNGDLDFTMSDHVVAGYQRAGNHWRWLAEVYYQRVFDVPVEVIPSSFSLVNTGAGFTRFFPGKLENEGTSKNYGIELTAERFFDHGWLFLFTSSFFESRYKGSDGVERNTDFNGGYALNLLASKEWSVKKKNAFVLGTKLTTAGGRWYGPADEEASVREHEVVYVDSTRNTLQFDPYFRWDIKINYRMNRPKTTHELGLDLVNVLNTQNALKLTYAPDDVSGEAIRIEYQLGFLPIFYWKVDF